MNEVPLPNPKLLRVPGDIPRDADGRITWWKPTWSDVARQMGWGWLYMLPLVFLFALGIATWLFPFIFINVWIYGIKLWILIAGGAFAAAAKAISKSIKARRDLFCIHCGYSLAGLADNYNCPECGRPYSFHLIEEYRRDPQWFIQRWKMKQDQATVVPFDAGQTRRRKSRDGT